MKSYLVWWSAVCHSRIDISAFVQLSVCLHSIALKEMVSNSKVEWKRLVWQKIWFTHVHHFHNFLSKDENYIRKKINVLSCFSKCEILTDLNETTLKSVEIDKSIFDITKRKDAKKSLRFVQHNFVFVYYNNGNWVLFETNYKILRGSYRVLIFHKITDVLHLFQKFRNHVMACEYFVLQLKWVRMSL